MRLSWPVAFQLLKTFQPRLFSMVIEIFDCPVRLGGNSVVPHTPPVYQHNVSQCFLAQGTLTSAWEDSSWMSIVLTESFLLVFGSLPFHKHCESRLNLILSSGLQRFHGFHTKHKLHVRNKHPVCPYIPLLSELSKGLTTALQPSPFNAIHFFQIAISHVIMFPFAPNFDHSCFSWTQGLQLRIVPVLLVRHRN